MSGFLGTLLSLLLLYRYAALAVITFVGAIGAPLPVALLLVADGAFAAEGYMNIWTSLAVATAANVAGDVFEYALVSRWGSKVLDLLHLNKDRTVTWVERYIRTHPGPTIFFSRFLGAANSGGNVFAGLAEVPLARFLLYDFLGNFVSIAPYLALGYVLGIYWESVIGWVDAVGWIALVVAAAVVAGIVWRGRHRPR